MTPIFSLLHTTARLPDGWKKAAKEWRRTSDKPDLVEYVLTTDDPIDFLKAFKDMQFGVPGSFGQYAHWGQNKGRRNNVDGWNFAAELATGKVLINVSDDWFPPEHWDTELLRRIPDLGGEYAIDVDNSDNAGDLMAFCIVTRPYYERYGYLLNPEYEGLMSDVEFTDVARRDGVVVNARHIVFRHLNPETSTTPWDDVYRLHRKPGDLEFGQKVYERRKAAGFPKTEVAACH